jgi:hypothetical protein
MLNWIFAPVFLAASLSLSGDPATMNPAGSKTALPPANDLEKIILVDVDITAAADAPKCYSSNYDKKRVEVQVEFDDPLNNLTDFVMEGDALENAGCFLPELKIIYADFTYVISLYCGSVVKYKNTSPYVPSNVKVANDLEVTEDLLNYLRNKHKQYFGPYNPAAASQLCPKKTFTDMADPGDDPSLEEEKDTDADELAKEALDKEGWFTDVPGVNPDEDSPIEPEGE